MVSKDRVHRGKFGDFLFCSTLPEQSLFRQNYWNFNIIVSGRLLNLAVFKPNIPLSI